MEINNGLNNCSLVLLPKLTHALVLKKQAYNLSIDKQIYTITKTMIQRNVVDFNKHSLLDGDIFFKQGGYFS